jgi:hypothetical protein
LDYTDRDFDALRARLISLIKSVPNFSGWTDFQVADLGTILMESFCFVGDVLAFNMDYASREAKWGSATQLRSLLRLSKMITYKPRGASAGTVTETIVATGLQANVTIPAGTIINTKANPAVGFQTLSQLVLTVAAPSGAVDVECSQNQSESFESTGQANQIYVFGQSPYLAASIVISTGAGAWTLVDNFLASRSGDLHFTLDVDASGIATATFGDGTTGAVPSGTVSITYKTGGGLEGEAEPNTIIDIQGTFFDALGNQVTLTATNSAPTSGAAEGEAINSIKLQAPLSFMLGDRTVGREDYETTARRAAGVGRALMLTRQEDSAVDVNTGMLWVVPAGLGFLTQPIRDAITAQFLKYPFSPSFVLDVMDPWYLDVSIIVRVYFSGSVVPAQVKAAILANLTAWFALTTTDSEGLVTDNLNVNFGYYIQGSNGNPTGSLALSDLFNVIDNTVGVRKIGGNPEDFQLASARVTTGGSTPVQSAGYHDLTIMSREFPRLGTLRVINGDTGSDV